MELTRLNKYLKDLGLCSRRKADEFIAKGYVKVNGQIITELGYKVDPGRDNVEILPQLSEEKSQFRYILLNKPKGYVCSKSHIDGPTVFELVPKIAGLTYAGRLDKDSHGLVLLSNDGQFVYSVAGSEFLIEKEYLVYVDRALTAMYLRQQSNGTIQLNGKQVRRCTVKEIGPTTYSIILTEGINRQIRRMAENQGYKVYNLKRIRIHHLTDVGLSSGEWRDLTSAEISIFKQIGRY